MPWLFGCILSVAVALGCGAFASISTAGDEPSPASKPAYETVAVAVRRKARQRCNCELAPCWMRATTHNIFKRVGGWGDIILQFRQPGGDWQSAEICRRWPNQAKLRTLRALTAKSMRSTIAYRADRRVLLAQMKFTIDEKSIAWTIQLRNDSELPLEIGDLALPLPMNSQFRRVNRRAPS